MSEKSPRFEGVTIFLAASNETSALRESVSIIKNTCRYEDISKLVILLKTDSCPSFFEAERIKAETEDEKIVLYVQERPWTEVLPLLPGMVTGSHFILMASDLEMDPNNVKDLIEKAKENPERIICAAKWLEGSVVEGYTRIHELGSRAINGFIRLLFRKDVREAFSFYQIFPMSVYRQVNFSNSGRILYEYTLLPLRMGFEYEEIPTVYKSRSDAKSNFNYLNYVMMAIEFCWNAICIRFKRIKK